MLHAVGWPMEVQAKPVAGVTPPCAASFDLQATSYIEPG